MSRCPSYERFVGPYEARPYCGARLSRRIPIHAIKIAAVALATVGLAVLWFATRAEAPLVQISQAGSMMNMACVRVQGLVPARQPPIPGATISVSRLTTARARCSFRCIAPRHMRSAIRAVCPR